LLLVWYPKPDSPGGRNQRKRSAYEKGTPIQMAKLQYYFSWIVSLKIETKMRRFFCAQNSPEVITPTVGSAGVGWDASRGNTTHYDLRQKCT
jgi:hypothetical protein